MDGWIKNSSSKYNGINAVALKAVILNIVALHSGIKCRSIKDSGSEYNGLK